MKQIKVCDWIFSINIKKTQNYYKEIPILTDVSILEKYPDSMKDFLAQCGVDYRKSCAREPLNEIIYYIYGAAYSDTGYEIDFYEDGKYASIIICLDDSLNNSSLFMMQVLF